MDDARFTVGFTDPPLVRQLAREDGGRFGLAQDDDVVFYMRLAESDELVIDGAAAAVSDPQADTVRYDWAAGDILEDGWFRGWFRVTRATDSKVFEFPEFDILGVLHAPGEGVRMGAVARAARLEIPVAWDALRRYDQYGDVGLQEKVETVKLSILNSVITAEAEGALDRRVIDYIAKNVAIEIIPAAIDYWTNQIVSQTTPQGGEIATYPDRIAALRKTQEYLLARADKLKLTIETLVGAPISHVPDAPMVDTVGPFITPGLEDFPAPFDTRTTRAGEPVGNGTY